MRSLKARLTSRRQESARTEQEALRRRQVPLRAFYGRDPEAEQKRNAFYAAMAKAFGWPDRYNEPVQMAPEAAELSEGGRDGRPAIIEPTSRTRAFAVITNSNPLEFLAHARLLATKEDDDVEKTARLRLEAGVQLRRMFETSQISGLKSANLGEGGGGRFGSRTPTEAQVESILDLIAIRENIPQAFVSLLERVVYRDEWVWEKAKDADAVIRSVLQGLDLVAVRLRMMDPVHVRRRWRRKRHSRHTAATPSEVP